MLRLATCDLLLLLLCYCPLLRYCWLHVNAWELLPACDLLLLLPQPLQQLVARRAIALGHVPCSLSVGVAEVDLRGEYALLLIILILRILLHFYFYCYCYFYCYFYFYFYFCLCAYFYFLFYFYFYFYFHFHFHFYI